MDIAQEIVERIGQLGRISSAPDNLTRIFLTPEHRAAANLLLGWMRAAGMTAAMDMIGNIVGRYEGTNPDAPCLMLGSHYDTVRNAGKWDGPLGVITAISCVGELNRSGRKLDFPIVVIAFADEEGVRFTSTLLGSRAVAGILDPKVLDTKDSDGLSMRAALTAFGLNPTVVDRAAFPKDSVAAYIELHIEQGPVLEAEGVPVGVVTAISGSKRLIVKLEGTAGHAGTVPMNLRRDALAAAAECVTLVESYCTKHPPLVGTVGRMTVRPGAVNVIPGSAEFTLDIRSPDDAQRAGAVADICKEIEAIAARRGLEVTMTSLHANGTTPCAPWLRQQIEQTIKAEGYPVVSLPSGAGHDGMAISAIADVAMIFVRCRGGISHNPAEHVTTEDVGAGARTLMRIVENFRRERF
jgi:allantoate deiminase